MNPGPQDSVNAASAAVKERLSIEEFTTHYAGQPYELVRGKLLKVPPYHHRDHAQAVAMTSYLLGNHVLENQLGEVLSGEVGVITDAQNASMRGVDVVVISQKRLAENDPTSQWITIAPELVIEVTEPSNTFDDMMDKVDEYFALGVEAVWILDPSHQLVLAYSSPKTVTVLKARDGDA